MLSWSCVRVHAWIPKSVFLKAQILYPFLLSHPVISISPFPRAQAPAHGPLDAALLCQRLQPQRISGRVGGTSPCMLRKVDQDKVLYIYIYIYKFAGSPL